MLKRFIRPAASMLLLAAPIFYFRPTAASAAVLPGLTILLASAFIFSFLWRKESDQLNNFLVHFAAFLVFFTAILCIMQRMALVSAHPFPLYWSEGNRFYDYSTLFGAFRYHTTDGSRVNAFITPGMALPWGMPFLIPNLTIRVYRIYYQLMWILPAVGLGWALLGTLGKPKIPVWQKIALILWVFVFLEQGPIYAPIILSAILVVIAARKNMWLGLALVFAAGLYTHFSRWTWSYAPGIWAGLLSLLAVPTEEIRTNWKAALRKPFLLGIAGFVGGLILPMLLGSEMAASLVDPLPFTARQPLLWYRLFPNSTYQPGILLGLLWAAGPIMIFLIIQLLNSNKRFHWLQASAILIALIGFLGVGIIASVKIGGGSNLHNLDMFLITLLLLSVVTWRYADIPNPKSHVKTGLFSAIIVLVLSVGTLSYGLRGSTAIPYFDARVVEDALLQVQSWTEKAAGSGDVLFIDHRQLLTFGEIENVPLVQEYEKKLLMDMAMSQNLDYFADFYQDLANQRFALIVSEPTGLFIKDDRTAFSEENNAYVEWVTFPLLCNYYPVVTVKELGLELLLPRSILPENDPRCVPYLRTEKH